jgi:hypothetical protein
MRKLSAERRQIVMLGGSMAAMSGVLMPRLHGHPGAVWLWAGVELAVVVRMFMLMRRVRKNGCV